MKIKAISFANAIKLGGTAVDFAAADKYDIVIKDIFYVCVTEKETRGTAPKARAFTTLFNVKWWTADEEVEKPAEKAADPLNEMNMQRPDVIKSSRLQPGVKPGASL